MPKGGLALRLPSAATKRALQPQASVGDDPVDPPDSARSPHGEEPTKGVRSRSSRLPSVARSRFLLEHKGSAQLTEVYEVDPTPLGVGGFGTVRLARLRGAPDVMRAVKAVKTHSAAAERSVRHEVSILKKLDHPHICRLLETFEGTGSVYLVMEYVEGIELFDYIQEAFESSDRADEGLAAVIMRQIIGALRYCHSHGVVHRDLKPENVMVQRPKAKGDEVRVKLIDFGLAVLVTPGSRPQARGAAGTAMYQAPETRKGGGGSPSSDMWSAGVVMHALLLGTMPVEEVRWGEARLDTSSEELSWVSSSAKRLLAGLLELDPQKRFTAADAAAAPWVIGLKHDLVPTARRQELMRSFSAFHKGSVLQRAMLTALAVQLASERISDLQEQFFAADRDRNGRISKQELAESLRGGGGDMDDWVESVFDSIDTDGSQELEYTEWLAAALRLSTARSDAALRAAFRVCDVDRDGKISQREVSRILAQTEEPTIAGVIREFDTNGDGHLDYEEFCTLIRRSLGHYGSAATAFGSTATERMRSKGSAIVWTPSTMCEGDTPSELSMCSGAMLRVAI